MENGLSQKSPKTLQAKEVPPFSPIFCPSAVATRPELPGAWQTHSAEQQQRRLLPSANWSNPEGSFWIKKYMGIPSTQNLKEIGWKFPTFALESDDSVPGFPKQFNFCGLMFLCAHDHYTKTSTSPGLPATHHAQRFTAKTVLLSEEEEDGQSWPLSCLLRALCTLPSKPLGLG